MTNRGTRAIEDIAALLRVPVGIQFHYVNDTAPNVDCSTGINCTVGAEAYWTLGTLAAGASTTISVGSSVQQAMVGNGNLIRSEFILAGTGATEVHAVKTVQVLDNPGAQLALSATANPVINNQAFAYNVDVGQIGNAALANTEVRLRLPAGVTVGTISDGGTQLASGEIGWTVGTVAVSSYLRRTVTVTGNGTATPGTIFFARATLTYDGGAPVDGLAEYAIPVLSATEAQPLTLTVTTTPNPAVPGNRLLYTATLTNTSARSVDGVGILVRLPVGLQFHYINETEPNAACSTGINCTVGAEASWTIGSMAAGATQIDHDQRAGAGRPARRQPHSLAVLSLRDGTFGAGPVERRRARAPLRTRLRRWGTSRQRSRRSLGAIGAFPPGHGRAESDIVGRDGRRNQSLRAR